MIKIKSSRKKCASKSQKTSIRASYVDKKGFVTYPHFRKNLKANHPALIVSEYSKDEYNYKKVSHSERDGRHLNDKIDPNPNPKDKRPMYIGRRVRHDAKNNFSKWIYHWKYQKK